MVEDLNLTRKKSLNELLSESESITKKIKIDKTIKYNVAGLKEYLKFNPFNQDINNSIFLYIYI